MLADLVLHPNTNLSLQELLRSNAHAVLLTGPAGAGKYTLAFALAGTLLNRNSPKELEAYPYLVIIRAEKTSIGIEQIRKLKQFTAHKTIGSDRVRRIIIIESADTMTIEAQNALLKVLEEPPLDTFLILTAQDSRRLRPTVVSRVQTVVIVPPIKATTLKFFKEQNYPSKAIERAYSLSQGQIGLLSALLKDDANHPLAHAITKAKGLLQARTYDRLLQVDELSRDKENLSLVLDALKRISVAALDQVAHKGDKGAVSTWHKKLRIIHEAESLLVTNANPKLLLTNLCLQV